MNELQKKLARRRNLNGEGGDTVSSTSTSEPPISPSSTPNTSNRKTIVPPAINSAKATGSAASSELQLKLARRANLNGEPQVAHRLSNAGQLNIPNGGSVTFPDDDKTRVEEESVTSSALSSFQDPVCLVSAVGERTRSNDVSMEEGDQARLAALMEEARLAEAARRAEWEAAAEAEELHRIQEEEEQRRTAAAAAAAEKEREEERVLREQQQQLAIEEERERLVVIQREQEEQESLRIAAEACAAETLRLAQLQAQREEQEEKARFEEREREREAEEAQAAEAERVRLVQMKEEEQRVQLLQLAEEQRAAAAAKAQAEAEVAGQAARLKKKEEEQRQAELEAQRKAAEAVAIAETEAARQREAEADRQREAEADRQREAEADRQREIEADRQRLELEEQEEARRKTEAAAAEELKVFQELWAAETKAAEAAALHSSEKKSRSNKTNISNNFNSSSSSGSGADAPSTNPPREVDGQVDKADRAASPTPSRQAAAPLTVSVEQRSVSPAPTAAGKQRAYSTPSSGSQSPPPAAPHTPSHTPWYPGKYILGGRRGGAAAATPIGMNSLTAQNHYKELLSTANDTPLSPSHAHPRKSIQTNTSPSEVNADVASNPNASSVSSHATALVTSAADTNSNSSNVLEIGVGELGSEDASSSLAAEHVVLNNSEIEALLTENSRLTALVKKLQAELDLKQAVIDAYEVTYAAEAPAAAVTASPSSTTAAAAAPVVVVAAGHQGTTAKSKTFKRHNYYSQQSSAEDEGENGEGGLFEDDNITSNRAKKSFDNIITEEPAATDLPDAEVDFDSLMDSLGGSNKNNNSNSNNNSTAQLERSKSKKYDPLALASHDLLRSFVQGPARTSAEGGRSLKDKLQGHGLFGDSEGAAATSSTTHSEVSESPAEESQGSARVLFKEEPTTGTAAKKTVIDPEADHMGYSEFITRFPRCVELVTVTRQFLFSILGPNGDVTPPPSKMKVDYIFYGTQSLDSRCRDFFDDMQQKFATHSEFRNESEERILSARDCLEQYVMTRIAEFAFRGCEVKEEDDRLARRMKLLTFLTPEALEIKSELFNDTLLSIAADELRKINAFKTPGEKVACVVKSAGVIFRALNLSRAKQDSDKNHLLASSSGSENTPAGADDFLPLFIWVVMRSHIPKLFSNCEYIQAYLNPARLMGKSGYCLINLRSAIEFVMYIEAESLHIDPKLFEDQLAAAEKQLTGGV